MNLYAESSAVLAWLLDEPVAKTVGGRLSAADLVLTSDLTSVECERALVRLSLTGGGDDAAEVAILRSRLNRVVGHWIRLSLYEDVLERARLPFPHEPIRSLDALHLASALAIRWAVPDILILSLDKRIRTNAAQLGFEVAPAQAEL